jgi:hypothetical protein
VVGYGVGSGVGGGCGVGAGTVFDAEVGSGVVVLDPLAVSEK